MRFLDTVASDVRYALRSFKRSPIFTSVVLATLIVGVTGVTAIFSYINAIYFAKLPHPDADRIVNIGQRPSWSVYAYPAAVQLVRESSRSFDRFTTYTEGTEIVLIGTEARKPWLLRIDTGFATMLSVKPSVGRLMRHEEIRAGNPVAMVSHGLWQKAFGSDSTAIGRWIKVDGQFHEIVGVMPENFRFPRLTDVFIPLSDSFLKDPENDEMAYAVLGRLRAGVSREAARAELQLLSTRLPPESEPTHFPLRMSDEMLDRRARGAVPFPGLFLGAGLIVLLIACTNVANLYLARGAERRAELTIRASLGATRGRLVRQTLTETLLLSVVAAAVSLWLSFILLRIAFSYHQNLHSWMRAAVDVRVTAFAVGAMLLVAVTAGLQPALISTRFDLASALKGSGDTNRGTRLLTRTSMRSLVAQLAMAVVLFMSTALLFRSYQHFADTDLGYPAERIAVLWPMFEQGKSTDRERNLRLLESVGDELKAAPDISGVALSGGAMGLKSTAEARDQARGVPRVEDIQWIPDGDVARASNPRASIGGTAVSDDYFNLLGISIREGRSFTAADGPDAEPVVVISTSAAKLLFPEGPAIGHTIQRGVRGDRARIIGVVSDIASIRQRIDGMRKEPLRSVYWTTRQTDILNPRLLARGPGDVNVVHAIMAKRFTALAPDVPMGPAETMARDIEYNLLLLRILGGLIATLAVIAVSLSVIGIYGVIAFGVARRTREIGVRLALGGTSGDVLRHIIGGALPFVGIALLLGLVMSVGAGRLMQALLLEVSPVDGQAHLVVTLLFSAIALLALYLPARRATRIDPLIALRAE